MLGASRRSSSSRWSLRLVFPSVAYQYLGVTNWKQGFDRSATSSA